MKGWMIVIVLGFFYSRSSAQVSPHEMVPRLFEAIEKENTRILDWYMPDEDWMVNNMKEFRDNPDVEKDAVEAMRKQWLATIESKFMEMVKNAREREIDFSKLKLGDVSLSEREMNGLDIGAMEVPLTYNGKTIQFGLMGIVTDDGYFLMDIPNSFGVFDQFFDE